MSFAFIQITDHHLCESETTLKFGFSPAFAFRAVMRHIAEHVATQADFIVSTGDLVEPASDAAYQAMRQMLGSDSEPGNAPGPLYVSLEGLRKFPMYFLPGNHDDRDVFFRNLFPAAMPMPLMNVWFMHQGVRFICLDWGPQVKAIANPVMLDFLSHALEADLPSVLLMHHHPVPVESRWLDAFIAEDVQRFWEIVVGKKVLGILCGHTHITYERLVAGIPVFGLRSTAFPFALQDTPLRCLQPPHYRFVTIQNGILTTRLFEVPL